MELPFGREEFLQVFVRFNLELWPWHVVAIAAAGFVVGLAVAAGHGRRADGVISGALAAFWLVSGVAFQWLHFTAVTPAGYVFGWIFVAGAAAFLWWGCVRGTLSFERPRGWRGIAGAVLVVYAIAGYPLAGAAVGHVYPAVPVLGVAPCPTTLLTVGLLLWGRIPVPRAVVLAPLAWSLVGLSAALNLGMVEDLGLAFAALCCAVLLAQPVPRGGAAFARSA